MKKQKNPNSNAAPPAPQQANTGISTEAKPVMYVVVRDGYRVSEREYSTPADPLAIAEQEFWTRVSTKWSYGEPVKIVQYDSKKHRTW